VDKFRKVLHTQLEYHKVEEKLADLQHHADNNTWTSEHTKSYQTLDTIITEAMLHAESHTWRSFSTTYEWSQMLTCAVPAHRYWTLPSTAYLPQNNRSDTDRILPQGSQHTNSTAKTVGKRHCKKFTSSEN
jgi:hypothetical protein